MILDDYPGDAITCFVEWMRSKRWNCPDGQFRPFIDVPPIDIVKVFLEKEHPECDKYRDLLIKAAEKERQNHPIRMAKEKWEAVVNAPIKDQFCNDRHERNT